MSVKAEDLAERLEWFCDRLEHVYGESPNVGYIVKAREQVKALREGEPVRVLTIRCVAPSFEWEY